MINERKDSYIFFIFFYLSIFVFTNQTARPPDYQPNGLCGVVVKTPARESEDPGFESRLTVHRKSWRLLNAFVIECD